MRFARAALAAALLAAVAVAGPKDLAARTREQSGAASQEKRDALNDVKRSQNAEIAKGTGVGDDDLEKGQQSIAEQKAAAIEEKHKCDCDACKIKKEGDQEHHYESHMISCREDNRRAADAVVAAKAAYDAAKAAREEYEKQNKEAADSFKNRCQAETSVKSQEHVRAFAPLASATSAADAKQQDVDNTIQRIQDLRAIAVEKDVLQFKANQGVVNAQNNVLQGKDGSDSFFRKQCVCLKGKISHTVNIHGEKTTQVYYADEYDTVLGNKRDGSECSDETKKKWVPKEETPQGVEAIKLVEIPAKNPSCKLENGKMVIGGQDGRDDGGAAAVAVNNAMPKSKKP